METKYLTLEEVQALHLFVMKATGGQPGLARKDSLESAIGRPQMVAYYEGADLLSQAALLCVSISQAQAFIDGNKRTSLAATDAFLRINGYALPSNVWDIIPWLEKIAQRVDKAEREEATKEFEDWLRSIVIPLPQP